jgi:hypothetical protein
MGMRCVTGAKPTAWECLASTLNLPTPKDAEVAVYLEGEDFEAWSRLAQDVQTLGWRFNVGGYAQPIEDNPEYFAVLNMRIRQNPFAYIELLRLVDAMHEDAASRPEDTSPRIIWS